MLMKKYLPRPCRLMISHVSWRQRLMTLLFGLCEILDGICRLITLGEFSLGLALWSSRMATKIRIQELKKERQNKQGTVIIDNKKG
jgi:hypothetical protein